MALNVFHSKNKTFFKPSIYRTFVLGKTARTLKILSFKNSLNLISPLIALCLFAATVANANAVSDDKNEPKVAIAIHGGAGTILKSSLTPEKEAAYIAILTAAIKKGHEQLLLGKDGTEAVTAAILVMEDSPLFNAGIGAVYTYDGIHELDASIMHGKHKQAGAVAGITTIKNPILSALLVMQKSEHVMLTAKGAESFSALNGLETVPNSYFNTVRRFDSLQKAKQRIDASVTGLKRPATIQDLIGYQDHKYGTVGAVVLDAKGNLVAGTSTGGMTAKRYGRVGDSPIIGAGTYANNQSCAVSATGHGEFFIRHNVASDICARVQYQGVSLAKAASTVMFDVLNSEAGSGGVIAIDSNGNIAMPFNTPGMYRASIDTHGKLTVSIYKD
ncbi:MAG: beta-aspartyl-peptidase (threonine type) [Alphaproteobacteria bacterium]|jgi:beta-aspartyl-peptidase (threonine type)